MDLVRFFLIFFVQISFSGTWYYLAYKILKRKRTRSSIFLAAFYLFPASGFIGIIFSYLFPIDPMAFIFYFLSAFLILFGPIFLFLFTLKLLKMNNMIKSKYQILLIILYAIFLWMFLSYPEGISYSESTGWKPQYTWNFFYITCLFLSFVLILPEFYLYLKLSKRVMDSVLKRKLNLFFIGVFVHYFQFYGVALYNTWYNEIFRSIWVFISLIAIPASILIYLGVGKDY